jgi:hypothetical protein
MYAVLASNLEDISVSFLHVRAVVPSPTAIPTALYS